MEPAKVSFLHLCFLSILELEPPHCRVCVCARARARGGGGVGWGLLKHRCWASPLISSSGWS